MLNADGRDLGINFTVISASAINSSYRITWAEEKPRKKIEKYIVF